MHFQRVNVEKVFSVKRHTTQYGVIQCAFHYVGVLTIGLHLQHPAGEHHQTNRGAAFRIHRVVGQIVVAAKCLAAALRADPAGNVQLALGHIVPQSQAVLALAFVLA
ncbi:hypothetical protein D3C73_935980 [compost metagenome]